MREPVYKMSALAELRKQRALKIQQFSEFSE